MEIECYGFMRLLVQRAVTIMMTQARAQTQTTLLGFCALAFKPLRLSAYRYYAFTTTLHVIFSPTDSQHSKKPGTQDYVDNPPPLSFKVPKSSDLPKTCSNWTNVKLPVDFLVLTVEDCEFLGFFSYLEEPFKSYLKELGYVYFGFMGNAGEKKLKVALMRSLKGSASPGGSQTVATDAIRILRPKAVFLVGACSGLDRGKVKLGDVVVSSKLTTAGYKTPPSRDVSNLIRHAADGWQAPLENPDALEVRVHCDTVVLSRPEGVGKDFNQRCPEAAAVEMDGEGKP